MASKLSIETFVSSSFYHLQEFANPDRLTPVYLTWIVPPFTHPLEATPPKRKRRSISVWVYPTFRHWGQSPL